MKRSASVIVIVLLFSIFSSGFVTKYVNSNSGLVGWWKFDEGSGTTVVDSSGNGNTGTLYNDPVWVTGKYGNALNFDGLNDYVRIPQSSSLDVTSQITMEAWVCLKAYVDYSENNPHIVSRLHLNGGHIYVLSLYSNSQKASYSVNPYPDQHSSTANIQLDTWTHLAMTYDGSEVRLYVNGKFDSSYDQSGSIEITSNWLAIGCAPVASGGGEGTYSYLNGTVDDVRIYNRALSQEEIQADAGLNRGPRMDTLYIKYYAGGEALFDALRNGEVDLIDRALTQARWDEMFNDPSIQAAVSPSNTIYQFDFNNNATVPTYYWLASPTSYKEFRQGIACLVNKTQIVEDLFNYSHRIDTPVQRPNGDWWVDWSASQYDSYGDLLGNYPYEYNSSLAAEYFDESGFVEGSTPNSDYDSDFPGSSQYLRIHPDIGEDMEPLIFYIRSDDSRRLEAGRILANNLRKMGIPVIQNETNIPTCYHEVLEERNYHIYTGGWSISPPNDALVLYTSVPWDEPVINYPQFKNATYDEQYDKMISQLDLTLAREAALKCQQMLIQEAVCVWLCSPSRVMGYRDIYGVVNARPGRVDNQWTFLKAQNGTRNEINYGLYDSPDSLNVLTDYNSLLPIWDCLSRIYDTLLSYCPYDTTPGLGGTMPWMAEDWEIAEWESPYETGKNLTKLTFYLRDGIKWHDGVELNSTDVKFTIDYLRTTANVSPYLYDVVSEVDHVTTLDAQTIVVYENVSNTITLDRIGTLPILPKHIFQNIINVTGYTPGADEGHLANDTLIGSGAWKYAFHNSSMLWLEANRDYFLETPPLAEVDFRYDWEMGCWAVDGMDTTMVGEAFATSGDGLPDDKWDPGCDMNGDCEIDMLDAATVASKFNSTWGASAKHYMPPPPTENAIFVETPQNPILVNDVFTVYVKMFTNNNTKLSGVQFKLYFDNAKLYCVNRNVSRIFGDINTLVARDEANQTMGCIWISLSSLATMQTFSGNTTLATISFNATQPSGSIMDFWNTKLASCGVPGSTCQPLVHNSIDRSVIVGVPTPTGTNITVAPAENAQLTFSQTTSEGVTTLNITQSPSTEFKSILCHNIQTTASYTGDITIQFAYDPTSLSFEDEQAMKIWRWNETSKKWLDITTWVDTDNNIVYGITPGLSMFGVTRSLSLEGNVSEQGDTTVGTPESPPNLPEGLMPLGFFEIETTTIYTGPINIRLEYNEQAIPAGAESFIQLWQWEESLAMWVDITTSVDSIHNIVYGRAPHLSMFGVTCIMPLEKGVVVLEASCSKTVVGRGYNMTIDILVENQGDFTKSFDLFIYANETVLGGVAISGIAPHTQRAVVIDWNSTDFPKGNYTLTACGNVIGWVIVTIAGDVTSLTPLVPDYKADMRDIGAICGKFQRTPYSPDWNPNMDVNGDDVVNMRDIGIACNNFMKDL